MANTPSRPRQRRANARLTERQRAYALLATAHRALLDLHPAGSPAPWTEQRYRDLLRRHGAQDHRGRASATTMGYGQIDAALAEMETLGWQRRAGPALSIVHRCPPARAAQWRKLVAQWCTLADAGIVRDRSEAAMLAWCERHITEDRLEWASAATLARCIEGLRAWIFRELPAQAD